MVLLKSLIWIPGQHAAQPGRVREQSCRKYRPRPLVFERLENRLCLSTWSEPVNLGAAINGAGFDNRRPAISSDGLSLYFSSNRPGGFGTNDLWVSHRATLNDPWGDPQNLGPAINYPGSLETSAPNLSTDQHWLFYFGTDRPGGYGGNDVWASYRPDTNDNLGWQTPINLGPGVNSQSDDAGPGYFEDPTTGIPSLYFDSNRPGGMGDLDIYASTLQGFARFGPAALVPELSSPYRDGRPTIRSDGLEMFFTSNRPGGLGNGLNLWVSTRASTLDRWSTPVDLGAPVNMEGFNDAASALSADSNTLFFYSNRPGGLGTNDLYMSTRLPEVADHLTLSVPANTTAGENIRLTVTAWDHYGNIATGYTGTVTFTSSDLQAMLPASYTFTTDDKGTHTFDFVLRTAGAQSIKVADTVGEVIGAQAAVVVNPAAADHLLITTAPTAVSGMPFDVTVTAVDSYGNIDTNYQGMVIFSSTDPNSGVVLPSDYTFTTGDGGDNGVHTFSGGVMLVTLGDQTFTVTDTASGITGSATITVGPGP
jgi:hypothetical protein